MRTITLPAVGITVSLKAYIRAVKTAKANPDAEFEHGLTCWWPCTGRQIVEQFCRGMQDRINEGVPYGERGKSPKFS